jgi:hypothetical protein
VIRYFYDLLDGDVENFVIVSLQTNAQYLLFRHEFSSLFLQACFAKLHASSLTKSKALTTAFGVSATSHFIAGVSVYEYIPAYEGASTKK